jgi:hypothetical protein
MSLAIVPAGAQIVVGIIAAPYVRPLTTAEWSGAIYVALVVAWLLALVFTEPRFRRAGWSHGRYPPPDGPTVGWYVDWPRPTSTSAVLIGLTSSFLQVWSRSFDGGGGVYAIATAVSVYLGWVRLIDSVRSREPSLVAITEAGVINDGELRRWNEIEYAFGSDETPPGLLVRGRVCVLAVPSGSVNSTDVVNVINHYLRQPHERAGIASGEGVKGITVSDP